MEKRPTRRQKILMEERGLNSLMHLVLQDLPNTLIVVHRITGKVTVLEKTGKEEQA